MAELPDSARAALRDIVQRAEPYSAPPTPAAQPQPQPAQPKRWTGTATEYAIKVRDDWEASRKTKVKTLTAALENASSRYVQKDGRPFNVRSLLELLRKVHYKNAGNPR